MVGLLEPCLGTLAGLLEATIGTALPVPVVVAARTGIVGNLGRAPPFDGVFCVVVVFVIRTTRVVPPGVPMAVFARLFLPFEA